MERTGDDFDEHDQPCPAAPVGSSEQLQQLTMHAYDDEQTVEQSVNQMLTYQTLPNFGNRL